MTAYRLNLKKIQYKDFQSIPIGAWHMELKLLTLLKNHKRPTNQPPTEQTFERSTDQPTDMMIQSLIKLLKDGNSLKSYP